MGKIFSRSAAKKDGFLKALEMSLEGMWNNIFIFHYGYNDSFRNLKTRLALYSVRPNLRKA
jgi:hypothetical protein